MNKDELDDLEDDVDDEDERAFEMYRLVSITCSGTLGCGARLQMQFIAGFMSFLRLAVRE